MTRQEKVGEAYLVTTLTKEKSYLSVYAFVATGERGVECWGTYIEGDGAIPKLEETTAWLEKVCLSIKPR